MTRRRFRLLSIGDLDRFVSMFDGASTFCIVGEHGFGGVRHGRAEIRDLLEEMRSRFRDLTITPVTVLGQGWPWNTVVATRIEIRATLPDGTSYRNEGLQMAWVRWGTVLEDRIYEDVDALRAALAVSVR